MQLLITHGSMARTRVLRLSGLQLGMALALLALVLMLASGAIYHFVFLKAAREGWPVVSQIVRLVVRDEIAQRDRFMRDNLDAIAQRVGEMQAKLVKLEAMRDRLSSLAGVKPDELKPLEAPAAKPADKPREKAAAAGGGRGGPELPLTAAGLTLESLQSLVSGLDAAADQATDIYTLFESRLLESRLQTLLVPSAAPVDGPMASGFGFRHDPFTGRMSLHTGLDYPAEPGTPIHAAAGGIVSVSEVHPAYGRMLEIDHGNGLATRYAHCSAVLVEPGTLVKRGQMVARVGNTGRSTGPHLHFEVLLDGVPQNPLRFLTATGAADPAPARRVAGR